MSAIDFRKGEWHRSLSAGNPVSISNANTDRKY